MKSICNLIFCLTLFRTIAAIETSTDSESNSNGESANTIYEFWKEQDKSFHLGKQKDVVLLLGNTGSGKSTTALFLTGDKLKSVDTSDDLGEFSIIDDNNKIGKDDVKSHTLIPELMLDKKSGVAYYDCPGFMDTRSAKHDLTIAYFLNKLLTYADSFKLVFVVTHSSLKSGENRIDFVALVKNAVKLIKDIEKYSDAIAMVVTKVDSTKTDDIVIKQVANFMKKVRNSIGADNKKPDVTEEQRNLNNQSIKFIATLLNQENDLYSRIGIFRRPDEAGPLDEIKVLQDERTQLDTMINRNLKYVRKESNDFGFIISPESKNFVVDLTEKITKGEFVTDVANVSREIKEFYHQREDLITDVSDLYNKTKLGADLFSAIRIEDPRLYLKEIINATYVLGIGISVDTIAPIAKHLEYVDFLLKIVDQKLTNPIELANKLNSQVVEHLKNSEKWYAFLIQLGTTLTKSNFQNDDMKKVANGIGGSLVIGKNDQITVEDSGLKQLIDEDENIKHSYLNVEKLSVNSVQLKALKNILHEYSSDHLMVTCSNKQLNMTAKGLVVKISDVIKHSCFTEAKYIKILALNTLIIDDDINKSGKQTQIIIIAPTWNMGKRMINLDGKNGEDHENTNAPNGKGGDGFPGDGVDGKPGYPGGTGGSLLAIGSAFINDKDLTIQLNGGNGGAGQHGGNGTLAIEGPVTPIPDSCWGDLKEFWDEKGYKYTYDSSWVGTSVNHYYTVFGKNGTKAGDGGNGGKQGNPGLAGKMLLFELDRTPTLNIFKNNGAVGAIGKGGSGGGNETHNGKTYEIVVNKGQSGGFSPGRCDIKITKTIDYGTNPAGKNGIDNHITAGMENADPPLEFFHPSITINEYKSFARERLIGSSRQFEIMNFLSKLTNNGKVRTQYDTLDLIDEFLTLESQYFQLREKIDFIPFLESLLGRIEEFAKTMTTTTPASVEHKRVLANLYTAILSKIYGINNKVNQNTVFDLEIFLEVVETNINKLRESIEQNNINTVRSDYKSSLKDKVNSANEFIETQITPEIAQIFDKVNKNIDTLIEESLEKQTDAEEAIIEKKRRRRELENQLRLRRVLGPIKLLASAASFFGPVGAAAGAAIGGATMLVESLALDENSAKGIDKVAPLVSNDFKTNMARVTEVFKQKPELIKVKMADLDKYIKEFLSEDEGISVSGAEVKAIKDKIKQSKDKMDNLNKQLVERIQAGNFDIPTDLMQQFEKEEEQLKEYSRDAKEKLEKHKSQLTDKESAMKLKLEKQLRVVSRVQNIVNIGDVAVTFYNQIRNDEAKLQIVGDAVESLEKDLKVLKIHEGKIYNVLIPQIRTIQNSVNDVKKHLDGKSHVELDIKKWNVRSTLNEVKLLFSQMTKDFSVHDELQLSIQKLDEGMATLIDVYDRIDSYSDSEKLAAYIANVGSKRTEFTDSELSNAVDKLREMVRSNIVLEEYEMAMHGFKQHYFPLAEFFTKTYNLPNDLQMNDTGSLIQKSMEQVSDLKTKIKLSQSLFNEYDESMHSDVKFDGGVGSQPPFYVWKYHEYKDEMKNLLQGNEITIKADVVRGVNQNAIKFNDIRLNFKLVDDALQKELNNQLRDFRVNMTMVGTNYYRCNNRYYRIPLDRNLAIDFTFENKPDGTPKDRNDVYKKIHENAPFLSPYVMWTIKLDGDFSKLEKYVNFGLDLELIGSGQYLKHGTFTNEICNSQLDKYYSFDKTISNANSLILSKSS